MSFDDLTTLLETRWLGRSLEVRDATGSTNADVAALARAGAPTGAVVVADRQHAGRGRLGRSWHSPPGRNLYLSMLLRPRLDPERLAPIAVLAGVVLAATLERAAGVAARIKWPNDVWVDGRKVAGILAEGIAAAQPSLILGVGINVNGSRDELPEELRASATTLESERGAPLDRAALLARFLGDLEPALERFERDGLEPFVAEANRLHWLAGRMVRIRTGGDTALEGRAGAIGADGRLGLRIEGRDPLAIASGEVTLVRPVAEAAPGSSPREGCSPC